MLKSFLGRYKSKELLMSKTELMKFAPLFEEQIFLPGVKRISEVRRHVMRSNFLFHAEQDFEYILSLAYLRRTSRFSYSVFFNKVFDDLELQKGSTPAVEYLELHELGHFYLGHMRDPEARLAEATRRVDSVFEEKIKPYISDYALKNRSYKELVEFFMDMYDNIAMDMEINSKLYSQDEASLMMKVVFRAAILLEISKMSKSFYDNMRDVLSDEFIESSRKGAKQTLNNILSGKTKPEDMSGQFPELYGFIPGMNYGYYFEALLNNTEKMIKNLIASGALMESEDGSGLFKVSASDIDNAKTKAKANNAATAGNGTKRGSGRGLGFNSQKEAFTSTSSIEELEDILLTKLLGKQQRKLVSDYLYYDRRGKFGNAEILVPKRYRHKMDMPEAFWVLVDVSGSVSTSTVNKVISTLLKVKDQFEARMSHIVQWSTDLVSDNLLLNFDGKIGAGGGTRMSTGMKYIFERMRPQDWFIVISDYEDDLNEWVESISSYKAIKKLGICHDSRYDTGNRSHITDLFNKDLETYFVRVND